MNFLNFYNLNSHQTVFGSLQKQFVHENLKDQIPTTQNELWKYTSLKSLSNLSLDKNKQSSVSLKSKFPVQTLEEAIEQDRTIQIPCSEFFEKLNLLSVDKTFYLNIPENSTGTLNINIDQIQSESLNVLIYLRLQKYSSLKVLKNIKSENGFLNLRIIVEQQDSSSCEFLNTSQCSGYVVDQLETYQSENTSFKYYQIGRGSQFYRHNVINNLNSNSSSAEVYSYNYIKENYFIDHNIQSLHKSPLTMSRQLVKSVLLNQSKSVFQGKIFIDKGAQKSDADQLSQVLMLSEKCTVDTKPMLDVYADDVKAAHGAAIGKLDSEELFYLQSRGLSAKQATELLIRGYGFEILDKISNESLKLEANQFLENYIFSEKISSSNQVLS